MTLLMHMEGSVGQAHCHSPLLSNFQVGTTEPMWKSRLKEGVSPRGRQDLNLEVLSLESGRQSP